MNLTRWFPAHVKPVRRVYYLTDCDAGLCDGYHYWTGKNWKVYARDEGFVIPRKWRGILK